MNVVRRWSTYDRSDRGAVLVELLLVSPVLLLLVFGIVDFGILYQAQINQNQGVRETARILARAEYDAISPACLLEDSGCVAQQRVPGYDPSDPSSVVDVWVIAPESPEAGKEVVVCAEKPADPIMPFTGPFLNGKTLKSKTTMRVEQNIRFPDDSLGQMDDVGGNNPPDWCTNG